MAFRAGSRASGDDVFFSGVSSGGRRDGAKLCTGSVDAEGVYLYFLTSLTDQMKALQWYVLRVRPGQEEKVKQEVEKAVQEAGIPEYVAQLVAPYATVLATRKDGSKVLKKKYISYLLVQADLSTGHVQEVFYKVAGVLGFMGADGYSKKTDPYPVPEEEIALMVQERTDLAGRAPSHKQLRRGMQVSVVGPEDHPLYKRTLEVREVSEDGQSVKVGFNLFSGSQQVDTTLEAWQVEPV